MVDLLLLGPLRARHTFGSGIYRIPWQEVGHLLLLEPGAFPRTRPPAPDLQHQPGLLIPSDGNGGWHGCSDGAHQLWQGSPGPAAGILLRGSDTVTSTRDLVSKVWGYDSAGIVAETSTGVQVTNATVDWSSGFNSSQEHKGRASRWPRAPAWR